LIKRNAKRIRETTGNLDNDINWFRAKLYTGMFYENIIPAVIENNEDKTVMILKAFQFSKAPENRYLIINCFETAIAIHFLDKNIIQKVLKNSEEYDYSMVPVEDWPGPEKIEVPPEWKEKFRYDSDDKQIIYEGIMKKEEKNKLEAKLTEKNIRML
jgi:hypothetical protein